MAENAVNIMSARVGLPFGVIIVRATLCGICVQLAVDMWNKGKVDKTVHPFMAMLPASAFVLLGCNHCITDMLYLAVSGSWNQALQILEAVAGNIIGAVLFSVAN